MKKVNFYFTAQRHDDTVADQIRSLQAWLTETEHYLKSLSSHFFLEYQSEMKRPDLSRSPDTGMHEEHLPFLELHFSFDFFRLDHAKKMIDLLEGTLEAFCYKQGLDYGFEYHLDE